MIIGVTGTVCSGKGRFSRYVSERGFKILSFGNAVREVAKSRKLKTDRRTLQLLGASERKKGEGVWARMLFDKISYGESYVVDGFRYPDQIEFFLDKIWEMGGGFHLVSVDAPFSSRHKWNTKRNRDGESNGLARFILTDVLDKRGGYLGIGQRTSSCLRMADESVYNDGDLMDLRRKAYQIVKRL
jgi:hypothetical protein